MQAPRSGMEEHGAGHGEEMLGWAGASVGRGMGERLVKAVLDVDISQKPVHEGQKGQRLDFFF